MNCQQSEELWTDYLERTLAPPLQRDLESHLASCASCPPLFQTFQEIVAQLHAERTWEIPPDVETRILKATRQALRGAEAASRPTTATAMPPWPRAAGWLAVAAMLALVLVWRPPELVRHWWRGASQGAHQVYSFGVRTYHRSERWLDELDVLRMTVGVAFEDRLDRLNERLKDLEDARRRTADDSEQESRNLNSTMGSGRASLAPRTTPTRSYS